MIQLLAAMPRLGREWEWDCSCSPLLPLLSADWEAALVTPACSGLHLSQAGPARPGYTQYPGPGRGCARGDHRRQKIMKWFPYCL